MTVKTREKRCGTSLIELVVVMAVGSAMLGIAVGVLYLMLNLDRKSRNALTYRTSINRLAEQFRDDVHAAADFKVVDLAQEDPVQEDPVQEDPVQEDPDQEDQDQEDQDQEEDPAQEKIKTLGVWELQVAEDHVIRYEYSEGDLSRVERTHGNLLGRESFELPEDTRLAIERSDDPVPSLVSLRIATGDQTSKQRPACHVRIDAVLGKGRRFVKSKER